MNLFTREVNDVREGISAELDHGFRVPVLVVGLVVFALAVSWSSTLFLGSLGGLVWLVAAT